MSDDLHAQLRQHVADATHDELGVLIDHLSEALEHRVGPYAPFIQQSIKGIRDTLRKAHGMPGRHAPVSER